jgi:hypothetical protein
MSAEFHMPGQALFCFVKNGWGHLIAGILQCQQFLARKNFMIARSDKQTFQSWYRLR